MKYLIFLFLVPLSLRAQKDTSVRMIKNLKGDLILRGGTKNVYYEHKLIVYNQINEKNKDKILLINKYIDTLRRIIIHFGNSTFATKNQRLKAGFTPIVIDGKNLVHLKIENNRLYFGCTIFAIDGNYIVKVENNKLLNNSESEQYISEKWMEIVSKRDIPVLQIVLNKEDNSISIYGLFFSDQGWMISSKDGLHGGAFPKPVLLMTELERNTFLYQLLKLARKQLPFLHEQ